MKLQIIVAVVATMALISSCSSRPCREPRVPELDQTKTSPTAVSAETASGTSLSTSPVRKLPTTTESRTRGGALGTDDSAQTRVRVYKPDGSRQCEKKAGVALEIMERELAGIVVHNREKRKDGLMHIQVCGGPTGTINLYEIDLAVVKQAEQRGFKRLED